MIDKIDQLHKDALDYRAADLRGILLSNQAVELTKANNYAKGLARMITGPGLK